MHLLWKEQLSTALCSKQKSRNTKHPHHRGAGPCLAHVTPVEPCYAHMQEAKEQISLQLCQKLSAKEPGQAGNTTVCCTFSGLAEKSPDFLLPNYGFLRKVPQKHQLYLQGRAELTKKKGKKKEKKQTKTQSKGKEADKSNYLCVNPASQAIATKLTSRAERACQQL